VSDSIQTVQGQKAGWSALTALHRLQTGGEVTAKFKITSLGLVYSVELLS
jgi:hypothetical protein